MNKRIYFNFCVILVGIVSVSCSFTSDNNSLLKFMLRGKPVPERVFNLFGAPEQVILDYSKYGRFIGVGTKDFYFEVADMGKLKKDSIAGIYPNEKAIFQDTDFIKWKQQGVFPGDVWRFLTSDNLKQAFYVWSNSSQNLGVKLFFSAQILEKSGNILPAINAYYATVVFAPKSFCYGESSDFVWYPAQAAMESIKRVTSEFPCLGMDYQGYEFGVLNGYDSNVKDDIITVSPGEIIKKSLSQKIKEMPDLSKMEVVEKRLVGKVYLKKYSNGHWQLFVGEKPFFVRGITYSPTKVGCGPQSDLNFNERWMFADENNNGLIDAPQEAWVDLNKNNKRDENEKSVGDFQLLKNIGVNTIRLYAPNRPKDKYDATLVNKPLLRKMYKDYGIMVAVGDFLGAYTIGTNASWEQGVDYTDKQQLASMKKAVYEKVLDLKDEPFVLMWILGNENGMDINYKGVNASRTNAGKYPAEYAKFLNEVVKMIHEIDPNHPVVVGNIELALADYYARYAPEIDILGVNMYTMQNGFGSLWRDAKEIFDRPVLITEYGSDAYRKDFGPDEDAQSVYFEEKFRDIVLNMAGSPGVGNSIGGFIFEYLDEWWKDSSGNPEDVQQTESQFPFGVTDGYSHEEWYGIAGQGDGKDSPFKRQLRKAYRYFEGTAKN